MTINLQYISKKNKDFYIANVIFLELDDEHIHEHTNTYI